jgi:hypothetical protein
LKQTRIALALAIAAAPAVLAGPSAARSTDEPTAVAAQFAETPWSCHPQKFTASGRSSKHKRFTYGGGGARFYVISYDGTATRCNGKTRISYHLYLDASTLPGNRKVTYQLQSAGVHKKWKPACAKQYKTNKPICTFELKGGEQIPRFGARPLYQLRGDGVIRYLRLVHVAEEEGGGGQQLASVPQNVVVKLSAYRKQPKAVW